MIVKLTAVWFAATCSGTSELDAMGVDAPAETEATIALGASVIAF